MWSLVICVILVISDEVPWILLTYVCVQYCIILYYGYMWYTYYNIHSTWFYRMSTFLNSWRRKVAAERDADPSSSLVYSIALADQFF